MTRWLVLDYGVGNLHSLTKALAAAGAKATVTQDPADLAAADVAVLPGVGAFGAVMQRLAPARDALRRRHAAGRPILGVCIGAQVLYESSAESPGVQGLGILPGTVARLPASDGKVPHMGWNQVEATRPDPVLDGLGTDAYVYYVHSYAAPPGPATVATTRYGTVFTAVLRQGATLGMQFHPEKSSATGARLLRNAVQDLEARA